MKLVTIIDYQYVSRSAAAIFVAPALGSKCQPQRGGHIGVIISAPLGLLFLVCYRATNMTAPLGLQAIPLSLTVVAGTPKTTQEADVCSTIARGIEKNTRGLGVVR